MKQISVKVDESFEKILRKKSEERQTAFSRYLRTLLETGLAVQNQIEQEHYAQTPCQNKTKFDIRLFELMTENTIISRTMLERVLKSEEDALNVIADAQKRSKLYAQKILDKGEI